MAGTFACLFFIQFGLNLAYILAYTYFTGQNSLRVFTDCFWNYLAALLGLAGISILWGIMDDACKSE